jgi:hypothetical protein
MLKLSSPYDAIATPRAMRHIFKNEEHTNFSVPIKQPTVKTETGMSALSIWMNETLKYKYAALPIHNVTE